MSGFPQPEHACLLAQLDSAVPPIVSAGSLPLLTWSRPAHVLAKLEERHSFIQGAVGAEERRLLGKGKRRAEEGEVGPENGDGEGLLREGLVRELKRSRGERVDEPRQAEKEAKAGEVDKGMFKCGL